MAKFDNLAADLKDMMSRDLTPEELEAGRQWAAKAKPLKGSWIFLGYDWGPLDRKRAAPQGQAHDGPKEG
jgi:hypothetical protein